MSVGNAMLSSFAMNIYIKRYKSILKKTAFLLETLVELKCLLKRTVARAKTITFNFSDNSTQTKCHLKRFFLKKYNKKITGFG